MSELPKNSEHLEFVSQVENPFTEKPMELYNPYAVLGLSFEEVPAEITRKAEEIGLYKVIKIAKEIIETLERVSKIVATVLGWFNIEPKKVLSADERVGAVIEAISKIKTSKQ